MAELLGSDDIHTGAGILSGSDRRREAPGFSLAGVRADVAQFVERPSFTIALSVVIVINAITLGLETSPSMVAAAGTLLVAIDHAALAIFTLEIAFNCLPTAPGFSAAAGMSSISSLSALPWYRHPARSPSCAP